MVLRVSIQTRIMAGHVRSGLGAPGDFCHAAPGGDDLERAPAKLVLQHTDSAQIEPRCPACRDGAGRGLAYYYSDSLRRASRPRPDLSCCQRAVAARAVSLEAGRAEEPRHSYGAVQLLFD